MKRISLFLSFITLTTFSFGQTYTFNDFVGTWNGTYNSEWSYIDNKPITMTIFEDGFYIETPGYFMPTTYPNTQESSYDSETNRFKWSYLSSVYAGNSTYTNIYYEIVSFNGNYLEMHYNFWDDPEPNPQAGILRLYRETETLLSPVNLEIDLSIESTQLKWEAPENINNFTTDFQHYNVYKKYDNENHTIIGSTEETSFSLNAFASAGFNMYYVKAVYNDMETPASNELVVVFETPVTESLYIDNDGNNVQLEWTTPTSTDIPIANIIEYNIYHKYEDNEYELIATTESVMFNHNSLEVGLHSYYITVIYQGGESMPSEVQEISLLPLGNEATAELFEFSIYPNPAVDLVNVSVNDPIENINIYNHLGQIVKSLDTKNTSQTYSVSNLPSGTYIFVIETMSGSFNQKVNIQR